LILINTGAGQLFGTELGNLADNIAAAGYSLDQIDDVVITHLHPDHVGGLMRDGKQVFPKAVIHADKADTDYWLSEHEQRKDGEKSHFFAGAIASLKAYVQSGPGARALYIFSGGQDTLYRLHGNPEWRSIGKAVSAGCVRLLNQDIIDLYDRVPTKAPIVVKQ